MKTKTQTLKTKIGNQYFQTLSVSSRTIEDMATILGLVAIVVAVLSLPVGIFLLPMG